MPCWQIHANDFGKLFLTAFHPSFSLSSEHHFKCKIHADVEWLQILCCPDESGINLHVNFEDVIAEPASVRSLDKVWLWSHALFEVSRLWIYRLISLLLAVPVALLLGMLFALLSCLHIWLIMPSVQLLLINMHWVKVVWASVLDLTISPFFSSLGRCCGAINIRWAKD
uniref:Caveolin n=1 Tax=Astyanax mexicanus TaxID=7994 RepID=A0A8B9JEU3_ASTMX